MRSTTFGTHFTAATPTDTAARQSRPATSDTTKSALWSRLFKTLVEARQAQADAIVARHMARHDDTSLKAIGWSEAEIADLRRRHRALQR